MNQVLNLTCIYSDDFQKSRFGCNILGILGIIFQADRLFFLTAAFAVTSVDVRPRFHISGLD